MQLTGASLASLTLSESMATTLAAANKKWGVQLFTIPQMASKDLKGTLKLLSDIGYKEIEFFGPYSFSATETIEDWKAIAGQLGITQNAFYGYTIPEVKKMLADFGLSTPSVHLDLVTMRTNLKPAMEALKSLGTKYVAIPALRNAAERSTLDDFKKLADDFTHRAHRHEYR